MSTIESNSHSLYKKSFLYLALLVSLLFVAPQVYAGQLSPRDLQKNPHQEISKSEKKLERMRKRAEKRLRKVLTKKNTGDNSAAGALLLGILNVLLILIAAVSSANIFFWLFALCFGIIPISLGVFSLRRMKAAGKSKSKTAAILGIVLGGLSLSILGFFIIRILFFFPS